MVNSCIKFARHFKERIFKFYDMKQYIIAKEREVFLVLCIFVTADDRGVHKIFLLHNYACKRALYKHHICSVYVCVCSVSLHVCMYMHMFANFTWRSHQCNMQIQSVQNFLTFGSF